jgi:hypothetical protein
MEPSERVCRHLCFIFVFTLGLIIDGYYPLPKSGNPLVLRIRSDAALYDFVLTEQQMDALDELDEGKSRIQSCRLQLNFYAININIRIIYTFLCESSNSSAQTYYA